MSRIATTLPFTELEVATGNYDTNRSPINRIVIHTMVGTWQGAAARFDNPTSQVSAHYGVKLDGGLIHWLEETFTAYHAGNYTMNLQSIGIEHEDGGDYNGVRPDSLYTTSAKLVNDICNFYSIPIDRQHILKHSEVIATGCPDALDIDRIVREALALNNLLEGLSVQVGYNPTFEGQDVMVNGVHYKSIKVDNVLVWKIEPVSTLPPETPVITESVQPIPPVITPPTPPQKPTQPIVVPPTILQRFIDWLIKLWGGR